MLTPIQGSRIQGAGMWLHSGFDMTFLKPRSRMLAPFEIRSFRYQWPADLATSWAFEMETIALGWFVLVETNSVLALTVFASLPYLGTPLAPLFGMVGDRIGMRRLLSFTRGFYLLLAAVIALLAVTDRLGALEAFLVAGLAGLVRPSDVGLRNVLIGETMPADRLLGALSLSRLTADSSRGIGALVGAGMVAVLGMGGAYAMIVLLYALSLVLTLRTGTSASALRAARAAMPARPFAPLAEMREALRLVWAVPAQFAALSLAFLINLAAYPFILGLLPYVAREIYGTGQTGLGVLVAAAAFGCVSASLLLSRLESYVLPARVMFVAAASWMTLTIVLGQTTSAVAGMIVLVLAGLALGLCIVPMAAIQLRNAPPELRGRITGLRTLAVYGLPLGLWLSGPVIERVGFATTAALYGGVGLLCTLAMLLRWRADLWPREAAANRRA